MIRLKLARGANQKEVSLTLPASMAQAKEALTRLEDACSSVDDAHIIKADSPVKNLMGYIKNADITDDASLEQLNQLALEIASMSNEERQILSGALDAESVNGLDDVLRIADRLDEYEIIQEVTTDRELGNYLVEHGMIMDFPEAVRPFLDYVAIGAEFYSDHGGAYTLNGYVVKKTELHPQLQPQAPIREESREEMLRLSLCTKRQEAYTLILPADEEYLSAVKKHLCIDDFAESQIRNVCFKVPHIGEMIRSAECPSVEAYNEFAKELEDIWQTDGALLTYAAVLDAERPGTLHQAYTLLRELDNYRRISEDVYSYGQQRLQEALGLNDEGIAALDNYMDFAQYGQDCMEDDHVIQTEFGKLRRLEPPFPEQSQTMQMKGF